MTPFTIRAISGRLGRVHATHRRIATAALWTGLYVAGAKAIIAAREVAVAWRYGVSGVVDAYQLSFTIVSWVPTILWSVCVAIFVPSLIACPPDRRHRLSAELNALTFGLALALGALTAIAGPAVVNLWGSQLPADTQSMAATMTREMAPFVVFYLFAAAFSIRLQARERFGYGFWEAAPSLGILIAIALYPRSQGGVLIWGTVAGVMVQAAVLALMASRADGGIGGAARPRADVWGPIFGALGLMALAQVASATAVPIDQMFAARLGEGSIAVLGYASRIIGLFTGIGTVVLGRALLPVLSDAMSSVGIALAWRQSRQWACLMFALGTIAAAFGWITAPFLVGTLYERGAFGASDTAAVADVLRAGLAQLPVFLAGMVLVQVYAAARRYGVLLAAAAAGLISKVVLNAVLVGPLHVAGIMVSTAGMYTASLIVLLLARGKLND